MRTDDPTQDGTETPDRPDGGPAATPPRPKSSRRLAPVKVAALAILMAATCWVVATLASPWLVPPYLVAMALILLPAAEAPRAQPSGRSAADPATAPGRGHPQDGPGGAAASTARATPDLGSESLLGGPSAREDSGPDPGGADAGAAAATATKPKRTRSRARKPSKPVAEPVEVVEATWIEVGPGKFVRAESPSLSAPVAGPHAPVEPRPELPTAEDLGASASEPRAGNEDPAAPVEPPATVAPTYPPEPVAEAHAGPTAPALGVAPEVAESDAFAESGMASRPDLAAPEPLAAELPVPAAAPAVEVDPSWDEVASEAPTVDGIAPQVEGPGEIGSEPDPLDMAGAAPVEPLAAFDEPEAASEPAGSLDPVAPDVAWDAMSWPECPPDLEETADEATWDDPEGPAEVELGTAEVTNLEELVDDSAGPMEATDGGWGAIPAEADAFEASADDARAGRPGGLHAWFSRRSGRTRDRRAPSGRPGRPPRSPRRPASSRRPSGRPRGRSRRMARTFPPRSPPRTRGGW